MDHFDFHPRANQLCLKWLGTDILDFSLLCHKIAKWNNLTLWIFKANFPSQKFKINSKFLDFSEPQCSKIICNSEIFLPNPHLLLWPHHNLQDLYSWSSSVNENPSWFRSTTRLYRYRYGSERAAMPPRSDVDYLRIFSVFILDLLGFLQIIFELSSLCQSWIQHRICIIFWWTEICHIT